MAEILSLHGAATPDQEPCKDTIEHLTKLLERAQKGQIKGVVYGYVTNVGGVGNAWGGSADRCLMVVAASMLNHRIHTSVMEDTPP